MTLTNVSKGIVSLDKPLAPILELVKSHGGVVMKIANSAVAMEGHSRSVSEETTSTNMRMWDNRRSGNANSSNPNSDQLSLSPEGLSMASLNAQASEMAQAQTITSSYKWFTPLEESQQSDLGSLFSDKDRNQLSLLEKMIEALTGKRFKFNHLLMKKPYHGSTSGPTFKTDTQPVNLPGNSANFAFNAVQPLGWGIQYHSETTHALKQTVDFKSTGSIQTEDGRSIDFELNYHFSQEVYSQSVVDFKAGDALIDPLVIRLDNGPMKYSKDTIRFDLDVDGIKDEFRVPIDNAGMLFLDKNGNHKVDDGSELFGPQTDDGFGELAALDSDKNGWIDESDDAFKDLRIWIRSGDGSDRYLGLIEAGVGALFVGGAQTKADLFNNSVEQVGQMKATGFYLKENGQTGLMHELDFKL